MYDIDSRSYLGAAERMQLCATLGLKHVPVPSFFDLFNKVDRLQPLQQGTDTFQLDLDLVLEIADGKSMLCDTPREGLVFKSLDGSHSFKAISNKFLLKNE
jgi:hypothetical protein